MNDNDGGLFLAAFVIGFFIGAIVIHFANNARWENRAIENNAGQYNNKTGKFEWIVFENDKEELDNDK